jgi:hypothetical protein
MKHTTNVRCALRRRLTEESNKGTHLKQPTRNEGSEGALRDNVLIRLRRVVVTKVSKRFGTVEHKFKLTAGVNLIRHAGWIPVRHSTSNDGVERRTESATGMARYP